ncbi:hypothetical protein BOX15_Mlig018082g1 [Macrostomum lignano]|uniref:Uncharacterized protein n=1 Tax=Macrostomum lignano TaxID=282301 RepID=A0A267E6A3_9PLAT|nr:hypothetical protein BOX15_Mlig018082g1 [Macrostomum lignano]
MGRSSDLLQPSVSSSRHRHHHRRRRLQSVAPRVDTDDCSGQLYTNDHKFIAEFIRNQNRRQQKHSRAKSTAAVSPNEQINNVRAKSVVGISSACLNRRSSRHKIVDEEQQQQGEENWWRSRCYNCNHELVPPALLINCRGRRRKQQLQKQQQGDLQADKNSQMVANAVSGTADSSGLCQAMRLANCSMLQKPTVIIGSKQPKEAANW